MDFAKMGARGIVTGFVVKPMETRSGTSAKTGKPYVMRSLTIGLGTAVAELRIEDAFAAVAGQYQPGDEVTAKVELAPHYKERGAWELKLLSLNDAQSKTPAEPAASADAGYGLLGRKKAG